MWENFIIGATKRKQNDYKYLYDTYYSSLCHYARRILKGVVDEEDVVQEIFIKLWERESESEDVKTISGYLYRTVHNVCLTMLRDYKEGYKEEISSWELVLADDQDDRERMLMEEEYYRLVYQMIESMSPERRRVILLMLEGKKNEEIALELNISMNTVKTLKKRAYAYLRDHLPREAWVMFLGIIASDF